MEHFIDYFVPEHYDLNLIINKHEKTLSGTVVIKGNAIQNTAKFHAVNLVIDKVTISDKKSEFTLKDNVLSFPLSLGEAEITIKYHGTLNENMQGAYLSTYEYKGHTETIVATQFESHYAREAFPCIDEPAAKAIFNLSLTVPDEDDTVLANTPIVKKDIDEYGFKYTFEPTPRMSTYLLAWVIGKFHAKSITNAHGTKITTYCALNQNLNSVDFANEIAARSLEFYDDNFGIEYPLPKLDQIALPDFEAGAMENWGLVTYRESMMLINESATIGSKKGVALTVAHELSHQWFGDLVTMNWWDDLWLNESFASVMEYFAVDHIHPEYKIFEGFFTGDAYSALSRDAFKDVQSVHQDVSDPAEISTLFDGAIVYSKGARLMLMLIRLMGWDNFTKGLRDYFKKHQYQNTVGDDLWSSLATYADFNVSKMMHSFIDEPNYPVITSTSTDFSTFTQKRFLLDGEMTTSNWPIVKVTEDMTGHYILNLSNKEFEDRLSKFDSLSLEEKLRILIDKNLLSKTNLTSAATLIPLIAKFKYENSASVWNIILSIIVNLKIYFDIDTKEEAEFKTFVASLVAPKLAEIGLTTRPSDDENIIRLRTILLSLDFYAETTPTIEALSKMYSEEYDTLDPEIREHIIDAKLYTDPSQIDKYIDNYTNTPDPELKFEFLFAGTISKDKTVLVKLIKLLEKTDIVKPQDQFHLFIFLFRNQHIRNEVFSWLTTHWNFVQQLSSDKSLDNYPRYTANSIRTDTEFKAWRDFFEPMKNNPVLSRAIEIGRKEIASRLDLIKADQESVFKALKNSN